MTAKKTWVQGYVMPLHSGQPRSCENMHRAILRGDAETVRSILEEKYGAV